MDWVYQYGFFLLKTITIVISILIIIGSLFSQAKKNNQVIEIDCVNDKLNEAQKSIIKKFKWKHIKKAKKVNLSDLPKLFLLDFNGDIKASQSSQLKEEITQIIQLAQPGDEVLIKIESPGGSVNGYGFAAAQLERLRHRNIPLNVCIDQVAASGGYLMACIANRIYAAPFAIVGSIGVIAQLPNFNKWLKKHDIEFEQITAGPYKRTLTMFGENTKEGRKKFTQDLELIHENFKQHVLGYRPQMDMEKVGTGEHWLAKDAMHLGLVDELKTSDDVILDKTTQFQVIHIKKQKTPGLVEKIIKPAANELSNFLGK